MLELDKSGKFWWLDGSVIEPWEITERWEELVNSAERIDDRLEVVETELATKTAEIAELEELVKESVQILKWVKSPEFYAQGRLRRDIKILEFIERPKVQVIMKDNP